MQELRLLAISRDRDFLPVLRKAAAASGLKVLDTRPDDLAQGLDAGMLFGPDVALIDLDTIGMTAARWAVDAFANGLAVACLLVARDGVSIPPHPRLHPKALRWPTEPMLLASRVVEVIDLAALCKVPAQPQDRHFNIPTLAPAIPRALADIGLTRESRA